MRLLADENIPRKVIAKLASLGHDIVSIRDIKPGTPDAEVVRSSKADDRIILTFDKDFGEKVFRYKEKVKGVVLLRLRPISIDFINQRIGHLLEKPDLITDRFVALEDDRIRIRSL